MASICVRVLNTKHDLTTSTMHCLFCIHLGVLHCLFPTSCHWAFWKTRRFFSFSVQTVRSVHPSNPQQIGLEVTVNVLSHLQLWKNLQLINARENITTSGLNFLTWLEACQASHRTHLRLLIHAKNSSASLLVWFSPWQHTTAGVKSLALDGRPPHS